MNDTTDIEIRTAFHAKKLFLHRDCPNTLVIDELGVAHGKNRIDIAVINGCIHGYEIKSSKDTLSRFPSQMESYVKCFEKLSVIAAENHVDALISMVPEWCGLILASKGPRGAIRFSTIRPSKKNPGVDAVAMAHFLWRREALDLVLKLGGDKSAQKEVRQELYSRLSKMLTVSELSLNIKSVFMNREAWRVDPRRT